jgi:hypothetical protein
MDLGTLCPGHGGANLIGFVAQDGGSVHDAAMGEVVRHAVVLRDAVVPEGEVVRLPFPAQGELGLGGVREQEP